jgi:hypothetical protein
MAVPAPRHAGAEAQRPNLAEALPNSGPGPEHGPEEPPALRLLAHIVRAGEGFDAANKGALRPRGATK